MEEFGTKHKCKVCDTSFYDVKKNGNCPKCKTNINDNDAEMQTFREKNLESEEQYKNNIIQSIVDLINNPNLFSDSYDFENYHFEDLHKIKTLINGNPLLGKEQMESHLFRIKNMQENKNYSVGIGIANDWYQIGDTIIFININQKDSAAIQYDMGKRLEFNSKKIFAYHDARITVKTPVKKELTLQFIKNSKQELVHGENVFLGKINCVETIDFSIIKEFFSRLIIYAIIIDNLKEQLREIYNDKRISIPDNIKRDILIRDQFQCKKCGSKIELLALIV